jgi:hypothetical protein
MSVYNFRLFQTKVLDGYYLHPNTPFHSYNPVICDRVVFGRANTSPTVHILIIKDGHSPLESIFYEPTTIMMNALTPNGLFSAYPMLLHYQISLHNPWIAFEINRNNIYLGRNEANQISSDIQNKYIGQGFLAASNLHHVETAGEVMMLKHRCRIDPICPLTPRGLGDRGCILWPLLNCKTIAAEEQMHYLMPGINFYQLCPQLDNIYWTVGAGACGAPQVARPSALVSYQRTFFD